MTWLVLGSSVCFIATAVAATPAELEQQKLELGAELLQRQSAQPALDRAARESREQANALTRSADARQHAAAKSAAVVRATQTSEWREQRVLLVGLTLAALALLASIAIFVSLRSRERSDALLEAVLALTIVLAAGSILVGNLPQAAVLLTALLAAVLAAGAGWLLLHGGRRLLPKRAAALAAAVIGGIVVLPASIALATDEPVAPAVATPQLQRALDRAEDASAKAERDARAAALNERRIRRTELQIARVQRALDDAYITGQAEIPE